VTPNRCKPFIEAADDVEDEGAVLNGFAEVGEVVGHALELFVVIGDGEITLHKSSELGIEDEGASLAVPKNWASMASQAERAVAPPALRAKTMSTRSPERVP